MSSLRGLLDRLEDQIGYIEKASNYDLDSKTGNKGTANYTKYARDINNRGLMGCQAQPWCSTMQMDQIMDEFGTDKGLELVHMNRNNYVGYSVFSTRDKFPGTKRVKNPQVGDLVVFTFSHIGMVVKVSGDVIWTIEGNTSAKTYERNGGMVAKKSYNKYDSKIQCFLRIDYPGDYSPISPEWKTTAKAISLGDSVNVREVPNGNILRQVNKGNEFLVDGNTDSGWTHVNVAGTIGWIASQYVKIVETVTPAVVNPLKYTKLKATTNGLNIRKDPSLNATVVGSINLNEKTAFTERQWQEGRCWFRNEKGWVSGKYLEGWVYESNVKQWWYVENGYHYPISEWKKIDGKWYYFDRNGWMLYNCYIVYGDHYRWLNQKGAWEPQWDTKTPNREKYKVWG